METNDGSNQNEKQYGINRIYRFARKKGGKSYIDDNRKELVNVEKKEHATVVKMEFTNNNCFILLSDGRVFSKGKEDCLGRDMNSNDGNNKSKNFEEIKFLTSHNEDEFDIEKSATVYNISAGDEHILALDYNYNIWGWGSNSYLQIHPKLKTNQVKYPVKLNLPQAAKVCQIFALQRSSMIICKNNLIYMWGSISEGYLGDLKEKGENFVKDFLPMDKVTAFILNDIKRNDENFTEVFINSRKLFNTKYNQTLEDNYNKINRIEKLQTQIKNLKSDIEIRTKQNVLKANSFNLMNQEKGDKKIVLLQDLLQLYEKKLIKISSKKDNLRKELINIEEEINQKNIDLGGVTEQIDKVEDKMESYNNEITEIKDKLESSKNLKDKETQDIFKKIGEKNKLLYNLKIFRDSLMDNLQIIIIFLEEKEKERKNVADQISKQTDKENQYLKSRYTVEDMIMILIESLNDTSGNVVNKISTTSSTSSQDKFKEKYLELFTFNDKLEKITFSELNKTFPYKIIDDLLHYSNAELKKIKSNLEITKSTLSETVKENLKILFDMIETKIELIKEQNNMIKHLYLIFNNLESEIKSKQISESTQYKWGNENNKNKMNSISQNVEYIYKEMILKYFEDAYKGGKSSTQSLSIEEKERLQDEQDNYIKEKLARKRKLEDRSKLFSEVEKNLNFDNIISFGYNNKK